MTAPTQLPNLPIVRRGVDPAALADYLDALVAQSDAALSSANGRIAELEAALRDATQREEAVQMTYAAAAKTKQELVEATEREVARKRAGAEEEADQIVADARTEALIILNNAKSEADRLIRLSAEESKEFEQRHADRKRRLSERVAALNETVGEIEARLRRIAEGTLDEIGALKAEIDQDLASYPDLSASGSASPPATPPQGPAKARPAPTQPPASRDNASSYQAPAIERVQQRAPLAPSPAPTPEAPRAPAEADEVNPAATEATRPAAAPVEVPPVDEPAAIAEDDLEVVVTDRPPQRASFYSRRSAGLPRIGSDNHALEVVSKMRTRTRDSSLDRTEEGEEEDLAIHNA